MCSTFIQRWGPQMSRGPGKLPLLMGLAILCYEHAIRDDWSAGAGTAKHLKMAGAARYVNAVGYAVPIGTTSFARYAAWGGPAGTVRQYMRLMGVTMQLFILHSYTIFI